jgi:hypothetical protein
MAVKGRPKKTIKTEDYEKVEKMAAYLTQDQVADVLGMHRETFRKLCNENEALNRHYKRGQALSISGVAQSLIKQGMDGNVAALIFFLKTKGGWKEEAPEAEVATPVAISFNINDAREEITVTKGEDNELNSK